MKTPKILSVLFIMSLLVSFLLFLMDINDMKGSLFAAVMDIVMITGILFIINTAIYYFMVFLFGLKKKA